MLASKANILQDATLLAIRSTKSYINRARLHRFDAAQMIVCKLTAKVGTNLCLVVLNQKTVQVVLALGDWRTAIGDLARSLLAAANGRLNALVAVGLSLVLERYALCTGNTT